MWNCELDRTRRPSIGEMPCDLGGKTRVPGILPVGVKTALKIEHHRGDKRFPGKQWRGSIRRDPRFHTLARAGEQSHVGQETPCQNKT